MKKSVLILMLFAAALFAKVDVTDIQSLKLGDNTIQPIFSADGKNIVFNSLDGGSIYNLENKTLKHFSKSAYDYVMDIDGKIIYRIDSYIDGLRMNSVKQFDTKNEKTTVLIDKKRLDVIPKITEHGIYFIEKDVLKMDQSLSKASLSRPYVISYNRSLLINTYGTSKSLKPLGDDKFYLWPSFAPNNELIAFVDVNDLYVMDLYGNIKMKVEEARAPKWSPDGKWIVFMRDSDDGHVFVSSDLFLVRVADGEVFQLTHTKDNMEMYPSWSPDGKKIVCEDAQEDKIMIITLDIK